jgi:hypothetical protein
MDLRKIGWDGMDWIDLAQDRDRWRALVNTVMNLRVPVGYQHLSLHVKFISKKQNCGVVLTL